MLKGSTSELLARLLEESDKAFGGTRLLTTQQLEGQQAGEGARRNSPTAATIKPFRPSHAGVARTKRARGRGQICRASPSRRGLQGVCTQLLLTINRKKNNKL